MNDKLQTSLIICLSANTKSMLEVLGSKLL